MTSSWPSTPPSDCPFPPSRDLRGVEFTGRVATYTDADTWYPSWASDGALYSPWTDGKLGEATCYSSAPFVGAENAATGQARILGDDPLDLTVENLGTHRGDPRPYGGRYPCGSLVRDGIWYYGTYCLNETPGRGLNWDVLGPFVGFRVSEDFGRTWIETPHSPSAPIFGESADKASKVKIGAPHFVDFGRNMEHSPDGHAYLVAHGATRPEANLSWISGDQIYLLRVPPSPATINDPASYEFFDGRGWTRELKRARPLVEWNDRCGCVTMTYDAPLGKHLMWITDGWPTIRTFNTFVLEADSIVGPWRMVAFLEKFGQQGYFVNLPSKFISPDGRTAWLCYSANFTNHCYGTSWTANPPGGRYALTLQEIRLL
jgi:hypothetical protein